VCPNGSKQVKGVDYDDSYSPTVRKETVFMLFHVTACKDWELLHVDIGTAYKEAIPNARPMFMKMAKDVQACGFSASDYVQLLKTNGALRTLGAGSTRTWRSCCWTSD
jgi:hypothetical protein